MAHVTMETILEYARKIGEHFLPEKIILFGSYAYGEPTEDSDVDLLVIMQFEGKPPRKAVEIRKLIGHPFAMDILVRTPDEITWRYKGLDPFVCDALDKGVVLYERNR